MSTSTTTKMTGTGLAKASAFVDWLRSVTERVEPEVSPEAPEHLDGEELLRRLREAGL